MNVLLEMDLQDIQKQMISVSDALKAKFKTIAVSDEEEVLIRQGVELPKSTERYGLPFGTNVPNREHSPEDLFLFVSKTTNREIAIAQWGTKENISYLRIL